MFRASNPATKLFVSVQIVLAFVLPVVAQDANHLSDAEIQSALQQPAKKHRAELIDMQSLFANTGSGHGDQLPKVEVFMPDAWIASQRDYASKQYLKYQPSTDDTLRALTVVAYGIAIGSDAGPTCDSVTRIALISDKSGRVVVESVKQEGHDSTWQNGFGATATCQIMSAKFMMSDLSRLQAAADKGEFLIGVFYSGGTSKMYKAKPYILKELGL